MTPQEHVRIRAAFLEVVAAPDERRADVIRECCGDSGELREEVERLLAHHQQETVEQPFRIEVQPAETSGSVAGAVTPQEQRRVFAPGTIIGQRYRIVARLGGGGMGEVYRSEDLVLEQTVALKFLPPLLAEDATWLEQFRREVRVARSVTHPNVCRTYDLGDAGGEQFISMEYVDGEDLASLLRRIGRLPRDKALDVAHQLCSGLAAAHAAGVLHRDLKPANIMLDGRGRVRITDFGLAGATVDLRTDRSIAGTPAYMAPEQIRGCGVDERTDIYALGLVLYELFTGQPAYRGKSLADFVRCHLSVEATPPSEIVPSLDPEIEQVIRACIAKDPARRPPSARAVAAQLPGGDALARALAAGQTPAPELIAIASAPHALRRTQVTGVLVLSLLLLAGHMALGGRGRFDFNVAQMKAPAILLEQARRLAQTHMSAAAPAEAWGYVPADAGAKLLLAGDAAQTRYALAHEHGNDLLFWYRTLPADWFLVGNHPVEAGRVTLREPLEDTPGMGTVIVDAAGRLVALSQYPAAERRGPPLNWSACLDASGVNHAENTACPPTLHVPTYADTRWAWCASEAQTSLEAARLEGAALGDAPLLYLALGAEGTDSAQATERSRRMSAAEAVRRFLILATMLAAMPLAWRNLQRGRGDARTATRLAAAIFILRMTVWLLNSNHRPSLVGELQLLYGGLFTATVQSLAIGLFYIALEPLARRFWPYALISWTRLTSGRGWDPIVGQHVLIGSLLGIFWAVLLAADRLAVQRLGLALRPVLWEERLTLPLLGSRYAVALTADALADALIYGLLILMVLALLHALLRRRLPAVLLTIFAIAALFMPYGNSAATAWLVMGIGCGGTAVWAVMRYGMLALITACFVAAILSFFPFTIQPQAWFSDLTLFALCVALIPSLGGFLAARRAPTVG